MQYQALIDSGVKRVEGVPLVLVRDISNYMRQLQYMIQHQEVHSNKRARTS